MDPNQLNQMNQMSIYQNYLLNNENKLDSQVNMNLLYNYQQYYKGQVRNNTNPDAMALNLNSSLMNQIPMQNSFLQNTNTPAIQSNSTSLNSNLLTTNYNNNFLNVDTPNYNVIEEDINTNSENTFLSNNNFNPTQTLPCVSESVDDKQNQENKNEHDIDRPWDRASKDPSIIQKGTELFVGNLSLDTTENDLYETFKDCGDVIDIRVHKNHQNKNCYAFIRLLTKEMLKEAMNKNMTILKGRKMKITKSNENSTIFIGNIRKNWKNSDIETKVRRIFPNCEKIENFPDPNNPSKNRGFCFVVFKNRNDAIKALNYVNNKGGINIDGVPLTCDWADVIDEDDNNSKQIFISGLNEEITEENLKSIFSEYGRIESIILSREHKNSKRKDLAFITYNTHEEAKYSIESFKFKQESKDHSVSILGERACVSLAFSQQAMQNKKKIKESRRKTTGTAQIPNILGKAGTGNLALDSNRTATVGSINLASLPNLISNVSTQISTNLQSNNSVPVIDLTSINPNNTNTTALLTMMNLLNMNKINMNINPALYNQMMSACLESIMSQNISTGNASILAQASQNLQNLQNVQNTPGIQNFNRLNNFNNFNNPTTLNTLKSLNNFNSLTTPNQVSLFNNSNYPFCQILNLGAPKINNPKRTKKFNQPKSYNSNPFLNANNPNSA